MKEINHCQEFEMVMVVVAMVSLSKDSTWGIFVTLYLDCMLMVTLIYPRNTQKLYIHVVSISLSCIISI